jgi:hypothetical protein
MTKYYNPSCEADQHTECTARLCACLCHYRVLSDALQLTLAERFSKRAPESAAEIVPIIIACVAKTMRTGKV